MTDDMDHHNSDLQKTREEVVEIRTRQTMLLEEFKAHEDNDDKRFEQISQKMESITDKLTDNKMDIQKLLIKMGAVISILVVVGEVLALNIAKMWGL